MGFASLRVKPDLHDVDFYLSVHSRRCTGDRGNDPSAKQALTYIGFIRAYTWDVYMSRIYVLFESRIIEII